MARKTVLVSDISGAELEPSQHVVVAITWGDARYVADVAADEVQNLLDVARKEKKRGRRPGKK